MSSPTYQPVNSFDKDSMVHLACVIMLCDDIGDPDQRIAYSRHYIAQRYGSEPEATRVPIYFRGYNTDEHKDALDLDVWASNALLYVQQMRSSLKRDIKQQRHKANKKLRKFCK